MKKILIVFMLTLSILSLAGAAAARDAKQGEFALELARVLDLKPATLEQAILLLVDKGIMPLFGWHENEPMTADDIAEVEASLRQAVAARLVKAELADGAIAAALAAAKAAALAATKAEEQAGGQKSFGGFSGSLSAPIGGWDRGGDSQGSPFKR